LKDVVSDDLIWSMNSYNCIQLFF